MAVPGVIFANPSNASTTFTMIGQAVAVTAVFETIPTPTYAVTVTSAGTGFSGGGNYASGATVNISAGTPPIGQQFKEWTTTSAVTFANATSSNTSFTMIGQAVTVTAVFEAIPTPTYAVTVFSAGTDPSGSGNYAVGATVNINAGTPQPGQQFKEWMAVPGVIFANPSNASTTFTMIGQAVAVTAVFETIPTPTYAVTVTSAGNGFSGGGNYASGATVNISAGTPPLGQQFKEWTTTSAVTFANATSSNTSFTMIDQAVTVTAVFETITNTVTVISLGTGSTGGGNYVAGATVEIKSGTPPTGQQFKNWTTTSNIIFADANDANTYFIMIGQAVTVTANFEPIPPTKYQVTVVGGSGSGEYEQGAMVSIVAGTPPAGQQFVNWTSSPAVTFVNINNASTSFNMIDQAVTVTAVFEFIPYTVTYSLNNGTGTTPTETPKTLGSTFTAATTEGITPPTGHQFKEWNTSADGSGTAYAAGATVTMPGNDLTLYAIWESSQYMFMLRYDANGGTGNIPNDVGFENIEWAQLGNEIPTNGSYKFEGWAENPLASYALYAPGAWVYINRSITLYAIWS